MSGLPEPKGAARSKPISYNPDEDRYVYYDDVVQRTQKIYPVDKLAFQYQKKLVIKRLQTELEATQEKKEPAIQMGFSGPALNNQQMIEHVEKETEIGKTIIRSEISYLRDYTLNIEEALEEEEQQRKKKD